MNLRGAWAAVRRFWQSLRLSGRLVLFLLPALAITLAVVLPLSLPQPAAPSPQRQETPSSPPTAQGWIFTFPTAPSSGSPAPLLDDGRLFYEPGWGALEVRHYLEGRRGVLGQWRTWVGAQEIPLADVIADYCLLYGINPKVLLTLLEFQNGLVDNPNPSPDALDWALGYRNEQMRGLESQLDWAVREIFRSQRDYPSANSLFLADGRSVPLPPGTNLGSYAVLRLVAQTGDEYLLHRLQGTGTDSFVQTYRRLFGEDPRLSWEGMPQLTIRPFLVKPYEGDYEVTAIFDHSNPFLSADGSVVSHMGQEAIGLPYDGHNGWDYGLDVGVPVLAAADGIVLWAGPSNDDCGSPALGVVLDHGNGYQTLYWHLSQVQVEIGQKVLQGEMVGQAGASGCAEGPHLHFGVHLLGRQVDPEGWCGQGKDPWANHPAGMVSFWLWADRFSPCLWPDNAILVDDSDEGFGRSGTQWFQGLGGVGGTASWTPSGPRSGVVPAGTPSSLDGVVEGATWRPNLPTAGRYRVYAFVPYWNNNTPETQAARYLIHHAQGESLVEVNQFLHVDRWVDLGVYSFAAGRQGFVHLDNLTDEVGLCVWFDALLWVPEQ
jgi:murein DD-endopeptidase MepM/ murein hydrolase activator NlpD